MNEEDIRQKLSETKEKAKQCLFYIVIGLVSVVFTCFLPLVGSEGDLQSRFPTTAEGWIVWSICNLSTAVLNVLIYICYMKQGHLNIKNDKLYLEGLSILEKVKVQKSKKPLSPQQWTKRQVGTKGVIIFFTTLGSLVGLTNAILRWNVELFLVYFVAVIMANVAGIIQMKKTELYWTTEFVDYARYVYNKQVEEEKAHEEAKKPVSSKTLNKSNGGPKNGSRKQRVSKHSRTSRKE